MAMLSKMIQYCKHKFSFKRRKVDTIHDLEAGAKLDKEAGKMQVDGGEHTSIPPTLGTNGVPNVEVLVIGDMQEVPPAAFHHPDQAQGELPAAARGSLARDKIFGVLKCISSFAACSAIAAVAVAYPDAVAFASSTTFAASTTVTGVRIIMFVDGLLLLMVHIFREEIFPEQARPWQYKLIKFSIVLLFTSTATFFVLVVAKEQ